MIKLVKLCRTYVGGDIKTSALNQVDLEIARGEFLAVTGPSGCGKSTLLNVLGLLDPPSSGEYWFEGQNVIGLGEGRLNVLRSGRIGFVFQNFNLIEELTVAENVALALEYLGKSRAEVRKAVDEVLEKLGVAHRAKHRPSQLSGGQQQRVAIARALVSRPAVLLADEPTGNLDSAHGDEVMSLLQQINREGTTIVMVTHSPAQVERATRAVHMLDGRIVPSPVLESAVA